MIRLHVVGDGARDEVSLPPVLERVLGAPVTASFCPWRDVRMNRGGRLPLIRGSGYPRKLQFSVRRARDAGEVGLVAVIDQDKDHDDVNIYKLRDAREKERPFPIAIGQAIPHGEAWLLDDPVAVRDALGLATDTDVPNVNRTRNPKVVLESLIAHSPRSGERPLAVFPDIAKSLDPIRCVHADTTGFAAFVREVQAEIGPLSRREVGP